GRQPDLERAAAAWSRARRRDRAAVQLDEAAREREADADAGLRAARLVAGRLREHLENRAERVLRHADAVVGDRDRDLVAGACAAWRLPFSGKRTESWTPARSAESPIRPPRGVYFAELLSRL